MRAWIALISVLAAGAAGLAQGGSQPAAATRQGHARRARRRSSDADQSRLRVGHRGRRQPQRQVERLVSQAGRAGSGSRGCRCCGCRASGSIRQDSWNLISPNMFAGSILDLEPDTAYEARFVLSDPDGVAGPRGERDEDRHRANAPRAEAVRRRQRVSRLSARLTRARRHEPAFDGFMCAYNYYCGGGDTTTTARPRVKPGDTILVHAGLYNYHPEYYGPDRSTST